MSTFAGAEIIELRIYDDPGNPETSTYKVVLPITVLEAIVDQNTGESLVQILARQDGSLDSHAANSNVHMTAEWKNRVQHDLYGELFDRRHFSSQQWQRQRVFQQLFQRVLRLQWQL